MGLTATLTEITSTAREGLTHWQQQHATRSPQSVEARLADRVEARGLNRCVVGYEPAETGSACVLACYRPDGSLAGRMVTMPAESPTWWLFTNGTGTRVSMAAFTRHLTT